MLVTPGSERVNGSILCPLCTMLQDQGEQMA